MSQSRASSFLEAVTNVVVGWIVAMITQVLTFPFVGLQASLTQHFSLSAVFVAVSFIRSYALRRLFDRIA